VGRYLADLVEERTAKYRQLAADARNAALNTKAQEAIDMYMSMAAIWEHLAVEFQHLAEVQPDPQPMVQTQVPVEDKLSRTVMLRGK
jgi:hypothetical protein